MKQIFYILLSLTLTTGCDIRPEKAPESPSHNVAFIVTTDYSTGSYSTIGLTSLLPYADLGAGHIHSDAVARYYDNLVYIVNRLGRNNIQILDPDQNFTTIHENSTGAGSNPHDIIVMGPERAYVSLYGETYLLEMNPKTGAVLDTIDLRTYANNPNGIPNMSQMVLYGSHLFVALQRLDSSWAPGEYSSVIVIDTNTNTVLTEIRLSWSVSGGKTVSPTNPYTRFRLVPDTVWQPENPDGHDHLFISCTGEFGYMYKLDGGIIAIDPVDLAVEKGFILAESSIGKEITDFIITDNGTGYAVTSDKNFHSTLIRFNITNGSIEKNMQSNTDNLGSLWSLAYHSSGRLFVCDRKATNPGVRIYDTLANDLPFNNNQAISTGIPPFEIIFIE